VGECETVRVTDRATAAVATAATSALGGGSLVYSVESRVQAPARISIPLITHERGARWENEGGRGGVAGGLNSATSKGQKILRRRAVWRAGGCERGVRVRCILAVASGATCDAREQ